jgi:hypothetical protein
MILRLLLWEACNRSCAGCCNKQWDLTALPVVTEKEIAQADMILLTGGEPMLSPSRVLSYTSYLRGRTRPHTPIILYTARALGLPEVSPYMDGITLTLHVQSDVEPFLALPRLPGSLRVNVFAGIDLPRIPPGWQVKRNIRWIEDCPLPPDETFRRATAP